MENTLEIKNISKKYDRMVLQDVDLALKNGVYGLLGPNGAGKTTLLNIIATALKPSSGDIIWNSRSIYEQLEEFRGVLGFLPQNMAYYNNFSGREFLEYMADLKEADKGKIQYFLDILHLSDHKDKKIGSYSGGMKQRLGIAQALLNDPKVLLLDEPTVGLDLEERAAFKQTLKKMSGEVIVILSTHIVSDVEEVADEIIFIKEGRITKVEKNDHASNLEEQYLSAQRGANDNK